jgi:8-oxo-dGTP diphosphatase
MPMAEAAADGVIHAAGCVLWRPATRAPEVALVHRTRYDDWSLPKGKREPAEHLLETAVREVAEETGVAVVLGRRLRSTNYQRGGARKIVDYWAARATAADPGGGFVPNREVDRLDWLPVAAARARLSYPRDAEVLDDFASGPADTVPCIVLRHAAAGARDAWTADDLLRPLDAAGLRDAGLLAGPLGCFGRARVLSSAAQRCVATVQPYAALAGVTIEIEAAFTAAPDGSVPRERMLQAKPLIDELVESGTPAVVCAHRENIPLFLEWACTRLGRKVPDGPPLAKADFWVLHIGGGTVVSAERHHPADR